MVTKELIKELRVKIDGLSQLTKELKVLLGHAFDKPEVHGISKETEKAYDSLILAKAWLGKVLEELGDKNPYKSGNKTVENVEPTDERWKNKMGIKLLGAIYYIEKEDWLRQDVYTPKADAIFSFGVKGDKDYVEGKINKFELEWIKKNYIEKVDWLRQEIQHITYIVYQTCVTNSKTRFHCETCYRHLCEARVWLDFELQRIKEQSDARNTNNTSNN
jgi:hypothetical protein